MSPGPYYNKNSIHIETVSVCQWPASQCWREHVLCTDIAHVTRGPHNTHAGQGLSDCRGPRRPGHFIPVRRHGNHEWVAPIISNFGSPFLQSRNCSLWRNSSARLDGRYFFSAGEDFISISRRSDDRKTLGWTSNSQAKPEMLSVLSVKIDLKL